MTRTTNTEQVTSDLNNYLRDNNYFDGENETKINEQILSSWDTKFKSAIIIDLKSKYDKVEVDFVLSDFELTSENNQGACLFFHKIVVSDKANLEFIIVYIKSLVNHNRTVVYLDSSYANVDRWQGKSVSLKIFFDRLKAADKSFGYFNPINLADLVK